MCGISSENAARRVNGGCTVNNYTSYRPDGFLAVSDLNNVTFQNVKATFDSNYTDGLPMYRPGIWFPGNYSNLTFKNMVLTDVAAHALTAPIGYSKRFYGLTFEPIDPATNSTGVIINVNSITGSTCMTTIWDKAAGVFAGIRLLETARSAWAPESERAHDDAR
jgi:hypothetical protein